MPLESRPEEAIFEQAREQARPSERAAFVDQACAGDEPLKRRVLELLAAHDASRGPLDAPPPGLNVTQASTIERPGMQIGPYKLLQQIGEGGMGLVYMAEQEQPVRRRVALKIIKPGMDTRQVIARFDAERQALALMDHPNIAKVLDAGTTESGRPYFVMELVKGQPITQYCDEHHLTPRQRLELFLPVCQAIQHAHQKGIIHRDIKPTNILVAEYDQEAVPKVIDFGVAKAIGSPLTEKTMFTGFGQLVGTLEYMSPEQAKVNQLDIDTRSDIYSLGVLLYELLTGSTPFDKQRLRSAAFDEMLRIIREEEPEKPSTRLSSAETLPSIAANRSMEPARLGRTVRGELDWIVMKALEKDRSRRYETANAFAADVQRYLADEPVQACPPSAAYRVKKFSRRYRTGLSIGVLAILVIVLLGSWLGWIVRDRAARRAALVLEMSQVLERAAGFRADGKHVDAAAELRRAEGIAAQGELSEELTQSLAALKRELADDVRDARFVKRYGEIRLLDATHVDELTSTFTSDALGKELLPVWSEYGIEPGVTPTAHAVALLADRPAEVQQELIAALDDSRAYAVNADMIPWFRDVVNMLDRDAWRTEVRRAWSVDDQAALERLANDPKGAGQPVTFLLRLGQMLRPGGNSFRLSLFRRIQREHPGDFWANHWLARELVHSNRAAEGVRYYTAALALRPQNPGVYLNRAVALEHTGDLDAAIADLQRAIELAPSYAALHAALGRLRGKTGDSAGAIAAYQAAVALRPESTRYRSSLVWALSENKNFAEARKACETAMRQDPTLGGLLPLINGVELRDRGQLDEAVVNLQKGMQLAPNAPPWSYELLRKTLCDLGQLEAADAVVRQATKDHPYYAVIPYNMANACRDHGQFDAAIAWYRSSIKINPNRPETYGNLGQVLAVRGEFAEALSMQVRGHKLGSTQPNWPHDTARWVETTCGLARIAIDDPAQLVELAALCAYHEHFYAAAQLYHKVVKEHPDQTGIRHSAARVAARAGCGFGIVPDGVSEDERKSWRGVAYHWLRADLEQAKRAGDQDTVMSNLAEYLKVWREDPSISGSWRGKVEFRPSVFHWKQDPAFSGLLPPAIDQLPADERAQWEEFWASYDSLIADLDDAWATKPEMRKVATAD